MTKTLLDNALLLQATAGSDPLDDRTLGSPRPSHIPKYHTNLLSLKSPTSLAGVRIGVITESLTMPALDPRVLSLFLSSAEKFKELGATVEEISIPMHKHGATIWTGISKASGALAKMGCAAGRRGYVMNDLNAKMWPMKQEQWDKAYPRYSDDKFFLYIK
jgi:amidase